MRKLAGIGLLGIVSLAATGKPAERPNVLLVLFDGLAILAKQGE